MSRISVKLDEEAATFWDQPLDDARYHYIWFDATHKEGPPGRADGRPGLILRPGDAAAAGVPAAPVQLGCHLPRRSRPRRPFSTKLGLSPQ